MAWPAVLEQQQAIVALWNQWEAASSQAASDCTDIVSSGMDILVRVDAHVGADTASVLELNTEILSVAWFLVEELTTEMSATRLRRNTLLTTRVSLLIFLGIHSWSTPS